MIHGGKAFGAILGRPTHWDSWVFAFVSDIIGGQAQTVELLPEMFNRSQNDTSTRIQCTIADVDQAWTSHPTGGILPFVVNAEPGSQSAMTRFLMLVPRRHAPIVINRQLSPKQLWTELGGTIIANGDQHACTPLLNWRVLDDTRPAASSPSNVLMPRPAQPLGHTPLINDQRELFYQLLPNMDPTCTVGGPSAARVADYLGKTLDGIRLSRQDTMERAAAAKSHQTTSQYFTSEGCTRLMTICGAMNGRDLPEIWCLLPQYGKKDCLAVELTLKQTAHHAGLTHTPPIVTPEFTKCPVSLNFAGNDPDNLSEGGAALLSGHC
jgi:hypothetical protein